MKRPWSARGFAPAILALALVACGGSALYVVNVHGTGLSVVPNTGMIWEPSRRPE